MKSSLTTGDVIRRTAEAYSRLPQVEAVAVAGSRTKSTFDSSSDFDFYIYLNEILPLTIRKEVADKLGKQAEVGNSFFEPGDEWIDKLSGAHVDVMFRRIEWIEAEIARVLDDYQASVGYSTCLWHNVLFSERLFDRRGWFTALQKKAAGAYPKQLQQAIIFKNFPLLRNNHSSYLHQIESAVKRGDAVSIHHRISALLASYFDVLFAVNEVPHPGEKRLISFALNHCKRIPPEMESEIHLLLQATAEHKVECANKVIDGLEAMLNSEGLLKEVSYAEKIYNYD